MSASQEGVNMNQNQIHLTNFSADCSPTLTWTI